MPDQLQAMLNSWTWWWWWWWWW